jgi:hypothetical protein
MHVGVGSGLVEQQGAEHGIGVRRDQRREPSGQLERVGGDRARAGPEHPRLPVGRRSTQGRQLFENS